MEIELARGSTLISDPPPCLTGDQIADESDEILALRVGYERTIEELLASLHFNSGPLSPRSSGRSGYVRRLEEELNRRSQPA